MPNTNGRVKHQIKSDTNQERVFICTSAHVVMSKNHLEMFEQTELMLGDQRLIFRNGYFLCKENYQHERLYKY